MPVYKYSKTANNNGTADPTVNFSEGMAPSAVNDSARAVMAGIAMYRDDVAGAIVTSGTSTAYTVSSFSAFDSLSDANGQEIWFTPHTTNGATVTLDVDGLGAKALRTAPNTELLAGVLIEGTPYGAIYNSSDSAWYLKGFFGNPYNIPLGAGIDYWGTTAPNSCFVFPQGNVISQTTYSALFALFGTTYNIGGEGAGMFRIPDKRGRVSAMLDNTTSILTSATMSPDGDTLGAIGGGQRTTLTTTNLPAYTPAGTVTTTATPTAAASAWLQFPPQNGGATAVGGAATGGSFSQPSPMISASSTFTGTAQGGASTPFTNLPPTIACNYIMRII